MRMVRQSDIDQYEGLSPETARLFTSPEFDRDVKNQKQFVGIETSLLDKTIFLQCLIV